MEKWLYVMFIEKTKTYNRLTKAAVERHVANIKALDEGGHLELCGVFKGYPSRRGGHVYPAGGQLRGGRGAVQTGTPGSRGLRHL